MSTPQIEATNAHADEPVGLSLTPQLAAKVRAFADSHGLTNREGEVLQVLVEGTVSAVQIAQRLGLSRNTVHNHIGNIFRRTRTNSKASVLARVIHHLARAEHDAPGVSPAKPAATA